MKVILLQDVKKIGLKHTVKDVADGYAHNFLIPRGLAENATKDKLEKLEALKLKIDAHRKVQSDLLAKNLKALKSVKIEISAKANEKGYLFKGIHTDEIVKVLKEKGHVDITEDMIDANTPLKEVGEFKINVVVGEERATFTLTIKAS